MGKLNLCREAKKYFIRRVCSRKSAKAYLLRTHLAMQNEMKELEKLPRPISPQVVSDADSSSSDDSVIYVATFRPRTEHLTPYQEFIKLPSIEAQYGVELHGSRSDSSLLLLSGLDKAMDLTNSSSVPDLRKLKETDDDEDEIMEIVSGSSSDVSLNVNVDGDGEIDEMPSSPYFEGSGDTP